MTPEETDKALTALLITVAVAAAILAVTTRHILRMIEAGRLDAVDISLGNERREYRIKSDSVRRLLETRK